MIRKLTRRGILLTLVLTMLVMWLPMASHAAAETREVSSYEGLESAVDDGVSDIILTDNIPNYDKQLTIESSLTLDLNGYNLIITIEDGVNSNGIKISNGAELVINGSNGGGTLKVENKTTVTPLANGAAINVAEGKLVLNSGNVIADGGHGGAGIGGNQNQNSGSITINGGTVIANGAIDAAGIGGGYFGNSGSITINGGSIIAHGGTTAAGIGCGLNGTESDIKVQGKYNYWFDDGSEKGEYISSDGNFVGIEDHNYIQLISHISGGFKSRTVANKATVSLESSYYGEYYYVIEKEGSLFKTPTEIKTALNNDTGSMIVGLKDFDISLDDDDPYYVYIVGESENGLYSNVFEISIPKNEPTPTQPPEKPNGPTGGNTQPVEEPADEPEAVPEEEIKLPPLHSVWAEPELKRAVVIGIIPPPLLEPEVDLRRPISRTEFAGVVVKVFENLAEVTVEPVTENPFDDTDDEDALKAYNAGIMVGVSATEFSPDSELTREQAATALTRVFKGATIPEWTYETDAEYRLDFEQPELFDDDADISLWAKESVYFMAANGIILGIGNNMFAPRAVTSVQRAAGYAIATREQAILMALRMVENMEIEADIEQE